MSNEIVVHIDQHRSERFYRRLRERVVDWLADHRGERFADVILLAPDLFVLLGRLMLDGRVAIGDRAVVAGALLYFLSPIDVIPDVFFPVGAVDDVVAAVIALNAILNHTDPAIIREHWEGNDDILAVIQRITDQADALLGSGALRRLGKALNRRTPSLPDEQP
jgi:uncharacterized membrane protein YkvA (DUF1232 family)